MTPDIIVNNIYLIVCTILSVFFFIYIIMRRNRIKQAEKFRTAGIVFQNSVLYELKGLYPIPRNIDPKTCERFAESIPAIKAAASEFRDFVPSKSRDSFDAALTAHCLHCKKINWSSCVAYKIKPGERKPEDEGPKERFRQNVVALLSFAKEKNSKEQ